MTPRNLPLEPPLTTMVLPPALLTSVGMGVPSCVWPPRMASMPVTRLAIFRSTSMPLCDSTTTTCAPLPRASFTTRCRLSSWMPKVQSATM
ncbi:hypothetical protein D9M68_464690 [compost metagenome]